MRPKHDLAEHKDQEIQYLHKKLKEYEDTIEDLQGQLDDEVERRRQEKDLADATASALEEQLKAREAELQNVLSSTLQNRRQQATFNEKAGMQVAELKREVEFLRRELQAAQQELELRRMEARAPRPVESLFTSADFAELCSIMCTHMGCDEREVRGGPSNVLRALESRAIVAKESLKCLTTFVSELGQMVWEEAGDIDGIPNQTSNFPHEVESLVTQKASAELHHELKRLMLRCEDLIILKPNARPQPSRAELVKGIFAAYRTADNCQKQTKAMVRRCHVTNAYGRFPKDHQENLKAVEQLTASFLDRLNFVIDHCLTPGEREGIRSFHPGRFTSPTRSARAESPDARPDLDTLQSSSSGRVSMSRRPPERYGMETRGRRSPVPAWESPFVSRQPQRRSRS